MDKLSILFELHRMLRKMEQDVGLDVLTPVEMDILLAAHSVAAKLGEVVSSDQIRQNELASGIAQATYYRALRSLLNLGFLEKAQGSRARLYVVRSDLIR